MQPLEEVKLARKGFVALERLCDSVYPALDHFDIGEDKLKIYRLNVTFRVDSGVNVDYVVVLKAANDVDYCVHLTNVREEFVAEALASGGAPDEARYIDEFDKSGGYLDGVIQFGELVQPLIGHCDNADIRLYSAEGVVRGLRPRIGYCIKKCALADIGQADYSELHGFISFRSVFNLTIIY